MQWSTPSARASPTLHARRLEVGHVSRAADTHRRRSANLPDRMLTHKQPALGPECTQRASRSGVGVLAKKPDYPPGEKYAYSNVGYTIAARDGREGDRRHLGRSGETRSFRAACSSRAPDSARPRARTKRSSSRAVTVLYLGGKFAASDEIDNTPIMGPAGTVHMTLSDLSTYATEHLRGELGKGKLLSAETYKRLHTPELNQYACGWVMKEPGAEIPYTVYWHNGSNTLWYALVVFIPEKNMVVAVTSNDGDFEKAEAAAWEIVKASVKQFSAEVEPATPRTSTEGRLSEACRRSAVSAGTETNRWSRSARSGLRSSRSTGPPPGTSWRSAGAPIRTSGRSDLRRTWSRSLTRMGHEPKDTVRLVVIPLGSRRRGRSKTSP